MKFTMWDKYPNYFIVWVVTDAVILIMCIFLIIKHCRRKKYIFSIFFCKITEGLNSWVVESRNLISTKEWLNEQLLIFFNGKKIGYNWRSIMHSDWKGGLQHEQNSMFLTLGLIWSHTGTGGGTQIFLLSLHTACSPPTALLLAGVVILILF